MAPRKSHSGSVVNSFLALLMAYCTSYLASCGNSAHPRIALVPRTTGSTLWEAEHAGAVSAASKWKCSLYWNAPTREDDVESQIALIERITRAGDFQGLVLAPDHALAELTVVRRALASGIQVVVISSQLALPPGNRLSYILNDEDEAGAMAAHRVGTLLNGRGLIAILGIDPDITGIMLRLRSFEATLARDFPAIQIVTRGPGAFNAAEAQQAIVTALSSHPDIDAILSLTAVSTRAAYFSLKIRNELTRIKLLGFEQDGEMNLHVKQGEIDSSIAEDTYNMGYRAVEQIAMAIRGAPVAPRTMLHPFMITRNNADSPEVQRLTDMRWFEEVSSTARN